MKKTIALAAALVFCLFGLQAQTDEFRISGNVTFTSAAIPFPGFQLFIASDNGVYIADAFTDDSGNYETTFDIPTGESVNFTVEAIDFCTGEVLTESVDNSQSSATADFAICSVIDPPPPPSDCEAFFDYFQADPAVLTVDFSDLSYSNQPINTWD